jgi:sec-independent protein translocase protein TatB
VFNLSGSEIIVILLLALVVLGPEKLPDAIRRAGRTYSELKKMGNSFQAEMKSVLDEPMKEMRETADLLKKSMDFSDGELTGKASASRASGTRTTAAPTSAGAPAAAAVSNDTPAAPADPPATTTDDGNLAAPDGAVAPATPEPAAAPRPEDELINRTLSGEA